MTPSLVKKEARRSYPTKNSCWSSCEQKKIKPSQEVQDLLTYLTTRIYEQPRKIIELYQQEVLSAQTIKALLNHSHEIIDEFMSKNYAIWWENIPLILKSIIYRYIQKQLPALIDNLFDILIEKINQFVSFETLIAQRLREYPDLLMQCKEVLNFSWPRRFTQTKKDKEQLIFFIIQKFLTPTMLIQDIFQGIAPSRARYIIYQEIKHYLEKPLLRSSLQIALGFHGYLQIKNQITDELIERLKQPILLQEVEIERIHRLYEYSIDRLTQLDIYGFTHF